MKVQRTRIAKTIADSTLKQGSSKAYAKEIAAYLLSEKRVGELDSLLRDVQSEWSDNGHVEVIARSAHPITDSVRTDITKQVRGLYPNASEIIVTEVDDPEVIGGVRLELANQQLDLTVEAKLNKFKQLTAVGKE